jgi:hypothetical protein
MNPPVVSVPPIINEFAKRKPSLADRSIRDLYAGRWRE